MANLSCFAEILSLQSPAYQRTRYVDQVVLERTEMPASASTPLPLPPSAATKGVRQTVNLANL